MEERILSLNDMPNEIIYEIFNKTGDIERGRARLTSSRLYGILNHKNYEVGAFKKIRALIAAGSKKYTAYINDITPNEFIPLLELAIQQNHMHLFDITIGELEILPAVDIRLDAILILLKNEFKWSAKRLYSTCNKSYTLLHLKEIALGLNIIPREWRVDGDNLLFYIQQPDDFEKLRQLTNENVAEWILNNVNMRFYLTFILEYHNFSFIQDLCRVAATFHSQSTFIKIFGMAILHGLGFDDKFTMPDQVASFLHAAKLRFPELFKCRQLNTSPLRKHRCDAICRGNSIYFKHLNELTNELFGSCLLNDFGFDSTERKTCGDYAFLMILHDQMKYWSWHFRNSDDFYSFHHTSHQDIANGEIGDEVAINEFDLLHRLGHMRFLY